jgi:beta-phosphoglucomutase family hydrolase
MNTTNVNHDRGGGAPPPAAAALEFDAAIFDMDGVLTQTATLHALAWKQMFDAFLRSRASQTGDGLREFTRGDYLAFVDGRPRSAGVEGFLHSRNLALPFGSPEDSPEQETICGLGNHKNALFNQLLARHGVRLYDSTLALLRALQARGVRLGLATSSRNSAEILARTRTRSLFGTVVDGLVSERLRLRGKPAPDLFTTAAANLGIPCARAIVVEDAVSGVQAGAAGGFALVIGLAREENKDALRENGADLVVRDLAETHVEEINRLIRAKRTGA